MQDLATTVSDALDRGARLRPTVFGFPHLAESLRRAGVTAITCHVPSRTTTYVTAEGSVVEQRPGLLPEGAIVEVAPFDEAGLADALARERAGDLTYPELVAEAWRCGVVSYDIDLGARTCTYRAAGDERHVEHYPAVELPPTG